MKTKGDVFITSEKDKHIATNEGVKVLSDLLIEEVNIDEIDVLIICGGNIENIADISKLYNLIQECNDKNAIIGGICAGRDIVTEALSVKKAEKTTVIDDRIVLSPGNEYVDFALTVGKVADIYEDDEDYEETVNYFKLFCDVG